MQLASYPDSKYYSVRIGYLSKLLLPLHIVNLEQARLLFRCEAATDSEQ